MVTCIFKALQIPHDAVRSLNGILEYAKKKMKQTLLHISICQKKYVFFSSPRQNPQQLAILILRPPSYAVKPQPARGANNFFPASSTTLEEQQHKIFMRPRFVLCTWLSWLQQKHRVQLFFSRCRSSRRQNKPLCISASEGGWDWPKYANAPAAAITCEQS